jgi:hypothetical protein
MDVKLKTRCEHNQALWITEFLGFFHRSVFGILNSTKEHKVSETGFVSVLR